MNNWQDLFRVRILERGRDYFEDGLVGDVEKTSDGYHAIVHGTDAYEVNIELQEEKIFDMQCTCPYADGGQYCKHMAAVLYKINENDESEHGQSELFFAREDRTREELDSIIEHIPTDELKNLVREYANRDANIRNKIFLHYAEKVDAKQMKRMKERISNIAYEHTDRNGFVNYYNAWYFTNALESFMGDCIPTLIKRKCCMQAFELVNQVFHLVGTIDMDDSDGGTTMIANICYDYWKEILQQSGEEEKEMMFQ